MTMINESETTRVLRWNPMHATLPMSGVVHCSYSGRPIKVSRSDKHGQVWELVDQTHPAYRPGLERFIGFGYSEFEPMGR